jgi:hypothetical protein
MVYCLTWHHKLHILSNGKGISTTNIHFAFAWSKVSLFAWQMGILRCDVANAPQINQPLSF